MTPMAQHVFDVPTLLFMDVLIGICVSISLAFSLRDKFSCPGARAWFFSICATTTGLLCIWLRLFIPLWLSVIFSNGLLVLGYLLLWLGFRQYNKVFHPWHWYGLLLSPLTALMQLALLLHEPANTTIRSLLISYVLVLLIIPTLWEALHHRKPAESGRLLCALALIFTLFFTLLRTISLQRDISSPNLLDNNPSITLFMASCGPSLLSIGISVLLISSQWLQQRLYVHATYDALTGIYNRYALLEMADTLALTSQLTERPWSLAMIDIDHFKQVNDVYGHPIGDAVLKRIAQELRHYARHRDLVARYGGEEFVVILSDCDPLNANRWAERVRLKIDKTQIQIGEHQLHVTVSIGLATATPPIQSLEDMLKASDQALYQAKQTGRNRVCAS